MTTYLEQSCEAAAVPFKITEPAVLSSIALATK